MHGAAVPYARSPAHHATAVSSGTPHWARAPSPPLLISRGRRAVARAWVHGGEAKPATALVKKTGLTQNYWRPRPLVPTFCRAKSSSSALGAKKNCLRLP